MKMKKILLSLMAFVMMSATYASGNGTADGIKDDVAAAVNNSAKAATQFSKVDEARRIKVGNIEREYWLYVPQGCPANAPMVVSMHGTSGRMTDKALRFHEVADKEKFIVVFPQGLIRNFPVFGGNATGWASTGEYSEDVDFIRALVEEVGAKYSVDRKRVYCCGFSNGGMNTYSLTNFCTDIFAAFGSISGFPINEFHMHHVGARPVPFIHIHGKADNFVKYSLVPNIIEDMVARDGANPVPVRTSVAGKYDKNVYEATEGGFPVVYYEIDGMGHNDFTANTEDGNSTVTMWKFFKQYTLDSPCDATLKWRPNLEAEGFEPKKHGWIVGASTIAYMFGRDQKTDANQNVYRSLQFVDGKYKMCFHIEGAEGTEATVKLVQLAGKKKTVLNQTITKDGDVTLMFNVEDGWGEYKLTISRKKATDNVVVSKLAVYSVTDDEYNDYMTSVKDVKCNETGYDVAQAYSLNGVAQTEASDGISIVKTKDGDVKKVVNF